MIGTINEMAVNLVDHGCVSMAHGNRGLFKGKSSFGDRLISERMTQSIHAKSDTHLLLHSLECAVDGVSRPRPTFGVQKDWSVVQVALNDFECFIWQVNDSGTLPAFSLVLGENDAFVFCVIVARFDDDCFLWPTASEPNEACNIMEIVVGNVRQDFFKQLWRNELISWRSIRLLQTVEWIPVDVALFDGPIEHPFEGCYDSSLVAVGPVLVGVEPLLCMIGLNLSDLHIWNGLEEPLNTFLVEVIGAWCSVKLCPVHEGFGYFQDGPRPNWFAWAFHHQLMESTKGLLFVGAETMTYLIDLDAPFTTGGPEPRLVWTRHVEAPKVSMKGINHSILRDKYWK